MVWHLQTAETSSPGRCGEEVLALILGCFQLDVHAGRFAVEGAGFAGGLEGLGRDLLTLVVVELVRVAGPG